MEEAILGPMRSCLIGQNIIQFQQLLQRIQMSCIGNSSAKAAVDIALYDVYCQYQNDLFISESSLTAGANVDVKVPSCGVMSASAS